MPVYDYFCEANGQTVTVKHRIEVELTTWGELCYAAQYPMGDTEFLTPVRRVISAPGLAFPAGSSRLKELGFTKLVKRDDGVYENVTRDGNEARYMTRGDPSSLPHVAKKIAD